MKIKVILQLK